MKILFISHDASRTGAPILLLNLIKWLSIHKNISADILIMNGKPWHDKLIPEFRNEGDVFVLMKENEGFATRVKKKFFKKIGRSYDSSKNEIKKIFKNKNYDLIYANTLVTSSIIPELKTLLNTNVIMHAHELEVVTQRFAGVETVRQAIPYIDKYILANSLIQTRVFEKFNFNIPATQIFVLPEYLNSKDSENVSLENKPAFRENCNLIIGSGTVDWRKGIDLFIQTAIQYRKIATTDFIFCWIGGEATIELKYELEIAGLQNNVQIIGQIPDIKPYLESADVFFLSSREDPYPLVCLEAASVGCPIVCFKDSGGMNDFVTEDNGIKVDFMDTLAAATAIKSIISDEQLKSRLSQGAKLKAKAHHIDIIAEKIWQVCF